MDSWLCAGSHRGGPLRQAKRRGQGAQDPGHGRSPGGRRPQGAPGHGHREGPGGSHRAHRGAGHRHHQGDGAYALGTRLPPGRPSPLSTTGSSRPSAIRPKPPWKRPRRKSSAWTTSPPGASPSPTRSSSWPKTQHDYAKANSARQTQLLKQNLVSRDTQEAALREELVTANTVRARRATLDLNKTEFVKEKVKAEKAVEEAEAALATIDTRITYTKIVTPISGVVSQVTTQQGENGGGRAAGGQPDHRAGPLAPGDVDIRGRDRRRPGEARTCPWIFAWTPTRTPCSRARWTPSTPSRRSATTSSTIRPWCALSPAEATKLRPEMTTQCQIMVRGKDGVLVIPKLRAQVGGQPAGGVSGGGWQGRAGFSPNWAWPACTRPRFFPGSARARRWPPRFFCRPAARKRPLRPAGGAPGGGSKNR